MTTDLETEALLIMASVIYFQQGCLKKGDIAWNKKSPNKMLYIYTASLLLFSGVTLLMNNQEKTSTAQNIFRIILGSFMIIAAIGHLTFQRVEFQAQVPGWVPLGKDLVVILSGIVEFALGFSIMFWKKQRVKVGIALALFYVAVFPGNIAQYVNGTNAFGLDTDTSRLIRLFFQPVLILWALWSTGALSALFKKRRTF